MKQYISLFTMTCSVKNTKSEKIKNKISIELRPKDIDTRLSYGYREGDSIVSKGMKSFLSTLVERNTRYLIASKLQDHSSITTTHAVVNSLKPFNRLSITYDNGLEFAGHLEMKKNLNTQIYICHSYSSFERGTNKNTNGLLRRYLPKHQRSDDLSQVELDDIVLEISNRPGKCLGYKVATEALESARTLTVAINPRM